MDGAKNGDYWGIIEFGANFTKDLITRYQSILLSTYTLSMGRNPPGQGTLSWLGSSLKSAFAITILHLLCKCQISALDV